ncbi:MAG: galactose mutarotase [Anaerolineae bacterium]|nr:galactose mutarotase [Anaerolineae bacterium]
MSITHTPWGQTADGTPVALYTLTNRHGVEARIATYGGIVVSLRVPDREGRLADVVLGFDSLEPYLARHPYFGALVGRVANRLGGARFTLNGVEYHVTRTHGENSLHGGLNGFDRQVWAAHASEMTDGPRLELAYLSPDGEEGYPGALDVHVAYTLTDDNALVIDYRATPDADTLVNLTNHSYFNLAGAGAGDILDHVLTIHADAFTPTNAQQVPTGEVRPVAGTPFDFRQPTRIGQRIHADDEQLRLGSGYDHNWALPGGDATPALAAEVFEPTSGRGLEVWTTEPGVQFYAGNKLGDSGEIVGKGGKVYGPHAGLCLETQDWPDAIHHAHFPSPIVRAGDTYRQTTIFKFVVR